MGGGISAATAVKESLAKGDLQAFQSLVKVIDCVFIDEEFPPDACILEYPKYIEDDIIWMRPHEFGSGVLFAKDDPKPSEIIHAHKTREDLSNPLMRFLSDFLVPVVSTLCRRPDYLRDLFLLYNVNAGLVAVQLWHNHKLETVIIDDHIPCNKYTFQPYFSSLSTGDAWLPLLEKAMAKLHGSYFRAVPTGGPRDLFRDLTGDLLQEYSCQELLNTIHIQGDDSPAALVFEDIRSKFQCGMCSLLAPSLSIDNWFHAVTDLGRLEASVDPTFQTVVQHAVAESRFTATSLALQAPSSSMSSSSSSSSNNSRLTSSPPLAAVKLLENEVAIIMARAKPQPIVHDGLESMRSNNNSKRKKKRDRKGGKVKDADGNTNRHDEGIPVVITQEMHEQQSALEELLEAKESWHSWLQFLESRSGFYLFLFNTQKISTQLATVSGRWQTEAPSTAAGGYHHAGWRRNPLYRLRAKHIPRFGSLVVSVCLSQPERRSRQQPYTAIGLLACKDQVLLNEVVADSGGYQCQRDVYLRITLTADCPTAVLVPSTLYPDTESDFFLTATYPIEQRDNKDGKDDGVESMSIPITLGKIEDWASLGLGFQEQVSSQWLGDSAAGRIDVKKNPHVWQNPCFKITFLNLEMPCTSTGSYTSAADNPLIELAVVLAPEDILGDAGTVVEGAAHATSNDKSLPVGYVCSACHIMTPAALGNLFYHGGYCGDMGVKDGYLGKAGYQNLPVTNRMERFRLLANDIHNNCLRDNEVAKSGSSSNSCSYHNMNHYRELIVMPSTWTAGCEASFTLSFFSNTRFVVEALDLRGCHTDSGGCDPRTLPFPYMAPPRTAVLDGYLLTDGSNPFNDALLDLSLTVNSRRTGTLNNDSSNNNAQSHNPNGSRSDVHTTDVGTSNNSRSSSLNMSRKSSSTSINYPQSRHNTGTMSRNEIVNNHTSSGSVYGQPRRHGQKNKPMASQLPSSREVLVNSFGVSTKFHQISSRQELEEERARQLLFKDAETPRRPKILNPFAVQGVILVNAKNYYARDMPDDDQYRGLFEVQRPDYFVPMDKRRVVTLSKTFRREVADHMKVYQDRLRAEEEEEGDLNLT